MEMVISDSFQDRLMSSDGDNVWLSPRISFSQDHISASSSSSSPAREKIVFTEDELSFDFCSSIRADPCAADASMMMSSADELFCEGKLLPLQTTEATTAGGGGHLRTVSMICSYARYGNEEGREGGGSSASSGFAAAMSRNIQDNPRSTSMTIAVSRSDYNSDARRRPCLSTANSRCSSPSSSSSSRSKWIQAEAAAAISTKVKNGQTAKSQTPSPSTAAIASSSSSRYSSKLKDIFRLKKTLYKDLSVVSIKTSSSSPEAASQASCSNSHGTSVSSRLLAAKSFWPFSRSNSAGESKSHPSVSPLPRRSNSAGESKTSSSSLLHANNTVAAPLRGGEAAAAATAKQFEEQQQNQIVKDSRMSQSFRVLKQCSTSLLPSSNHHGGGGGGTLVVVDMDAATSNLSMTTATKKGLPPLPNTNVTVKKIGSFSDSATANVDQRHHHPYQMTEQNGGHGRWAGEEVVQETTATDDGMSNNVASALQMPPPPSSSGNGVGISGSSSATAMRRCPSNRSVARNFARGSPGRRSNLHSPSRGNAGRISIKNLDHRGRASTATAATRSRGLMMRPKDMLSRDGSSGRIPPVLNVPVPSRRGIKVTKSKMLDSLGSFFSKKDEKSAGSYVLLATADAGTQNGA